MKVFRYNLDRETGLPHIYDHGVTEAEVEEVFSSRRKDDLPGRKTSRLLTGQTAAGRYLAVVYVPDDDKIGVFIVTAYDLQGKPLVAFRRRMRRRFG